MASHFPNRANGHFFGAHGFVINNPIFVDDASIRADKDLRELYKHCAPAAIFGSKDRGHATTCLDGTAIAILNSIRSWSDDIDGPPILWLSGAVGTGKTTIAHTMATEWVEQHAIFTTFFFSPQTDSYSVDIPGKSWMKKLNPLLSTDAVPNEKPTERKAKCIPLIETLAFQLAKNCPDVKEHIISIVHNDPSIPDGSMEKQFTELIMYPLQEAKDIHEPVIIIIDALDECNSATVRSEFLNLVIGWATAARPITPKIKFFITSHPEPSISDIMEKIDAECLTHIPIGDMDADIKHYLTHELSRIQSSHPRFDYGGDAIISELLSRSSGQFIFASTVMQYLQNGNPQKQMNVIMKATSDTSFGKSFHNLDALYYSMLDNSSRSDRNAIISRLGYILSGPSGTITLNVLDMLCSTDRDGESLRPLRPLNSLLQMPNIDSNDFDQSALDKITIKVIHRSFEEFLTDEMRSRDYYINVPVIRSRVSSEGLQDLITHTYKIGGNFQLTDKEEILRLGLSLVKSLMFYGMSPISFAIHFIWQTASIQLLTAMMWFWFATIGSISVLDVTKLKMPIIGLSITHWIILGSFDFTMKVLSLVFPFVTEWQTFISFLAFLIPGGIVFGMHYHNPVSQALRVAVNLTFITYALIFTTPAILLFSPIFVRLPLPFEILKISIAAVSMKRWLGSLITLYYNLQTPKDSPKKSPDVSVVKKPKKTQKLAEVKETTTQNQSSVEESKTVDKKRKTQDTVVRRKRRTVGAKRRLPRTINSQDIDSGEVSE